MILGSPWLSRLVPRVPLVVFYAFYPAHLLAIWLVYGPYPRYTGSGCVKKLAKM